MESRKQRNVLIGFLYQPAYKVWRHLFIITAIVSTTLSQSFFVFGNHPEVATSTIYETGIGLAVVMLLIIYMNVYYLSPYFLGKRAYASYIIVLLLLVSGFIILKQGLEYLIFSSTGIYKHINIVSLLDGASNMILYTICVASTAISTLLRQLMADHTVISHLQNEQLKHSIAKIKSSIQPKFLFATLDYVSKNVSIAPAQASDTLFKLSELLRYQLYDSARSNVLLSAEIEFVRNYLQLQKQSFANDFNFEINIQGNARQLITPVTLSMLVEEILNVHPQHLHLTIVNAIECMMAECKITGIRDDDYEKMKQKLQMVYADDIAIAAQQNSILITLRIC